MKLLKNWQWREEAIIYNYPSEVIHQPYPFYWYRATGLQIDLVKQVSKYCGIVQDSNEFIPNAKEIEAVEPVVPEKEIDLSVSQEWRSWITLGEVIEDPLPLENIFEYGNIKHIQYLTEDGKIKKVESYQNDKLLYTCNFEYKKIKGNSMWIEYTNSDGVKVIRQKEKTGDNMKQVDKYVVRWISAKPIDKDRIVNTKLNNLRSEIDNLYGKRK
jgi:hypothetical protein